MAWRMMQVEWRSNRVESGVSDMVLTRRFGRVRKRRMLQWQRLRWFGNAWLRYGWLLIEVIEIDMYDVVCENGNGERGKLCTEENYGLRQRVGKWLNTDCSLFPFPLLQGLEVYQALMSWKGDAGCAKFSPSKQLSGTAFSMSDSAKNRHFEREQ